MSRGRPPHFERPEATVIADAARSALRETPKARLQQVMLESDLPGSQVRLDAACRHHGQRQPLAVERAAQPGYVQRAQNLAGSGILHRSRGTGPRLDSSAEVLRRVHLHWLPGG